MPDLRGIWRPGLYHGRGKRPPFFEGAARHAGLKIVGPITDIQALAREKSK